MKRLVAEYETLVGDVNDLRAFALTADLRSFTEAAKVMGESKATISRSIARLESALGVSLLRRTPRQVEPTDDGTAYRVRVAEVLELLADANASARGALAEPSGVLRVTTPPGFEDVLGRLFATFMTEFPQVVVSASVSERFVDLGSEHVDVALRATGRLADSALVAHRLFESESVAVASPSYLAKHGAPKRPTDLAAHRIVRLGQPGARVVSMRRGDDAAIEVRIACALATNDIRFAKALAIAGGGVTFLPRVAVRCELESGALAPVLRPYTVPGPTLYLLHRGGRFLPPKVRAFREVAIRELARGGAARGVVRRG
jgi:DNA-binding transcriptional LysR family regulator